MKGLVGSTLIAAIDRGATVLVANRRGARAVQLAYAQVAQDRGLAAWRTPDVLTLGAWLERAFRRLRADGSAERLLPASHAAALWDRVVTERPPPEPCLNRAGVARIAQRAWQRALLWRVPTARLALEPGDEAQALAQWIADFDQLCHERQWIAGPQIVHWLMRHGSCVDEPLLIAQPRELAPLERELFEFLAARGDPIEFAAAGDRPADVEVAAARDAETELAMAADWARRQVESGAGAVCVVVPDLAARLAAVRRAFEDCFVPGARRIGSRRHAGAFEIAATRRLDQFPHVDAALELLELARGRGPSALAGRIVLSPFLGGAIAEANARARLELRLRSDGREHFGVDELERLASAAACPVLTERLAAARALLRGAPRRATASVWAERFLELLGAFGWPGDAPLDSDERQTVEQVRDACGLFGALDEVLGDLDFDRARYEFRRLVSAQHFEPRTLPAPVTVIDPDTVVGVEFDALWIAGMDAGRWPPAPDPDPLLPIALQIEAGMPWATANAAREHARQRFDRVLKGAARAIASWPQWDGDAEQRPSPWLAGLPTAGLDQPVTRAYRATLYDARPALETIEDPGLPPLASPHAVGGARALELQALCPFRAQVELRLRARPLEQSGPEVDPLERGDLAHRALERLWRELGGHAGLMGRTTDSLATTVRAVVQQCAQPLLTGATAHRARLVAIEVDLACERIGELLECERGRRPFRIQGPEVRGALALGGLEFDLRIDRIDELDDGSRIVIDYKTGASASARHWYGERPRQPQLPLYALAYADVAAVAVAQLARGAVGFEGVARDAGLLPGIDAWPSRANPTDAADWPGLIEHWRVNLERLAREHRDGVSRVDPLPQACRYCHLSLLCRIDDGSQDADATVALDE